MSAVGKTILHVDDDADDRELLRDMMQMIAPGIKVAFAENGLQALELLKETKEIKSLPCLIVLDLNMPYLDGRETFELIKADPQLRTIPLVVLSSGANPVDKSMFSKEGIAYFNKPVELSVMKEIANSLADLCC